jgi:phosphoribosylformylglycinamidine cyclo-ligase
VTQEERGGDAYASAGVDIAAGNQLVRRIAPLAMATARAGTLGGLGGFGAVFDLKAEEFDDPLLVAATDGVGTKLLVAEAMCRYDTVGIDLVAMCVNDLVVQGAEPLFFLDYLATGRLDVEAATSLVTGIAKGCTLAGCALIGGETAEMPGVYASGRFDLAGFAVGAVERRELRPQPVVAGDRIIGIAASGLHSNGYSLVRRIIADAGLLLTDAAPFEPERRLGEVLLEPTRIYVRSCRTALRHGGVRALAHITGGGLLENPPRVVPDGLRIRLDAGTWALPPVMRWLADAGALDVTTLTRTFNCGLGMLLFVAAEEAPALVEILTGQGEKAMLVGAVEAGAAGPAQVLIEGVERAWPVAAPRS